MTGRWKLGRLGDLMSSVTMVNGELSGLLRSSINTYCSFILAGMIFETCDIIILAVKPNLFPIIIRDLKICKGLPNQLVLSVMSGITLADIEKVY